MKIKFVKSSVSVTNDAVVRTFGMTAELQESDDPKEVGKILDARIRKHLSIEE